MKGIKVNKILHICVILALLSTFDLFGVTSYATEKERSDYSLIDERVEGILSDFSSILPEGKESFKNPYNSSDAVGLRFLLESIFLVIKGESGVFFSFLTLLLGISLLMSLSSMQDGEMGRAGKNAVFLISSAVVMDKVFDAVASIGSSLKEINAFFASVIPIITAANALGVSPGLATAQTAAMSFTLQIYSFFSGNFLYSLAGIMLIVSALSALDEFSFGKIASGLRKTFLTFMGAMTAFVGAVFSLQSIISASADSGLLRGAKYAVSGMIPIVGSSISSALSTLLGGVTYLKGVVGGGAIAVILSMALAPLISLIIYRLCFCIASFFASFCGGGADSVLSTFASVFDALIAVYSMTVVVYVLELSVFLKGGMNLA